MGRTEILDCHLDEGTRTKVSEGIRWNYQVGRTGLWGTHTHTHTLGYCVHKDGKLIKDDI